MFAIMARNSTNEPNRLAAASIGAAIPVDTTEHGGLSEHHAFGVNERSAGDYAEDLAAKMLATTRALSSIQAPLGTSASRFSRCRENSSGPLTSLKLPKDTKMGYGRLRWPRRSSCRKIWGTDALVFTFRPYCQESVLPRLFRALSANRSQKLLLARSLFFLLARVAFLEAQARLPEASASGSQPEARPSHSEVPDLNPLLFLDP